MVQQGQVFRLESTSRGGGKLWAYRYRAGGRESKRISKGGLPANTTQGRRWGGSSRSCGDGTGSRGNARTLRLDVRRRCLIY